MLRGNSIECNIDDKTYASTGLWVIPQPTSISFKPRRTPGTSTHVKQTGALEGNDADLVWCQEGTESASGTGLATGHGWQHLEVAGSCYDDSYPGSGGAGRHRPRPSPWPNANWRRERGEGHTVLAWSRKRQ